MTDWSAKNPYSSNLTQNFVLNGEGSGKETRHIVFDLALSGLEYKAGDALGVVPVAPSKLVEDLLEISRYDVSANALTLERFLIVEFLERVIEQNSSTETQFEFPSELSDTIVEADKRRLARVISNLLENAEFYAGGATCIEVIQINDGVSISVFDNGPGIALNERSSIFERFARGSEGGRRGSGTGTGLGLSLVAEHVKLHGGSVAVSENLKDGVGSKFTVLLPGVVR